MAVSAFQIDLAKVVRHEILDQSVFERSGNRFA